MAARSMVWRHQALTALCFSLCILLPLSQLAYPGGCLLSVAQRSAKLPTPWIYSAFTKLFFTQLYCKCVHARSLQPFPSLCNPMDCSPLGCSVHGIIQATILDWAVMPSSRGYSQPRDRTRVSYLLHLLHWQVGSSPLAPSGEPSALLCYA